MRHLPLLLSLALLPACTGGEGGNGKNKTKKETRSNGTLTTTTWSEKTNNGGLIAVPVDVDGDVQSFMVTADAGSWVFVEAVDGPSGQVVDVYDWADGDLALTGAFYVDAYNTQFNWPARAEDGPLENGTWTVTMGLIDDDSYYMGGEWIDLAVQTKEDTNLDTGTVTVEIAFAEGVGDEPGVVSATEDAVDRWREIWGERGLDLQVSWVDVSLDPDLSYPGEGDDLAWLSEEGTDADVHVLIGESIDGATDLYGVAGGIPGALISTPGAGIVVSWLTNSGGDGSFSAEDTRLYGETLAHEVGHYIGLFHPVETEWNSWDALDDTEDCGSTSSCESALGENLMFPYPVCDFTSCFPQGDLTGDQAGVSHHYTGTL